MFILFFPHLLFVRILIFVYHAALRFTVEPNNVVATEGKSVLLPCEGELTDTHGSSTRKNHKKRLDLLPSIRWRGPDGQDIGVVGDTFRYEMNFEKDFLCGPMH